LLLEDVGEDGFEGHGGGGPGPVAAVHERDEFLHVGVVELEQGLQLGDGEVGFVFVDVADEAEVADAEVGDGVVLALEGAAASGGCEFGAGEEAVGAGVLVALGGTDGPAAAAVGRAAGRIGAADGPGAAGRAVGAGGGASAAGFGLVGRVFGQGLASVRVRTAACCGSMVSRGGWFVNRACLGYLLGKGLGHLGYVAGWEGVTQRSAEVHRETRRERG